MVRALLSLIGAAGVALLLFGVMQGMISSDRVAGEKGTQIRLVDFINVDEEDALRTKQREMPKEPEPPKETPPQPKVQVQEQVQTTTPQLNINVPNIDVPFGVGQGPFLGGVGAGMAAGGDLIPLVRIEPQYPREAARGGIEGSVRVAFTVLEDGSVEDVSVIESNPPRVFDRAAVRAILKWKFKPRIVAGKPVKRRAEQTLNFNLQDKTQG